MQPTFITSAESSAAPLPLIVAARNSSAVPTAPDFAGVIHETLQRTLAADELSAAQRPATNEGKPSNSQASGATAPSNAGPRTFSLASGMMPQGAMSLAAPSGLSAKLDSGGALAIRPSLKLSQGQAANAEALGATSKDPGRRWNLASVAEATPSVTFLSVPAPTPVPARSQLPPPLFTQQSIPQLSAFAALPTAPVEQTASFLAAGNVASAEGSRAASLMPTVETAKAPATILPASRVELFAAPIATASAPGSTAQSSFGAAKAGAATLEAPPWQNVPSSTLPPPLPFRLPLGAAIAAGASGSGGSLSAAASSAHDFRTQISASLGNVPSVSWPAAVSFAPRAVPADVTAIHHSASPEPDSSSVETEDPSPQFSDAGPSRQPTTDQENAAGFALTSTDDVVGPETVVAAGPTAKNPPGGGSGAWVRASQPSPPQGSASPGTQVNAPSVTPQMESSAPASNAQVDTRGNVPGGTPNKAPVTPIVPQLPERAFSGNAQADVIAKLPRDAAPAVPKSALDVGIAATPLPAILSAQHGTSPASVPVALKSGAQNASVVGAKIPAIPPNGENDSPPKDSSSQRGSQNAEDRTASGFPTSAKDAATGGATPTFDATPQPAPKAAPAVVALPGVPLARGLAPAATPDLLAPSARDAAPSGVTPDATRADTTAADATPAGSSNLPLEATTSNHFVSGAQLSQSGGRGEMHIAMQSDDLGNIELHTRVSGDSVGASITVEKRDAHTALATELPALQQALSDKQLRVEQISLTQAPLHGTAGDPAAQYSGGQGQNGQRQAQNFLQGAHSTGLGNSMPSMAFSFDSGEIFDAQGRLSVLA